ncbi:MAG: GNAT family N-acetyltransferase [Aureliella sp.]
MEVICPKETPSTAVNRHVSEAQPAVASTYCVTKFTALSDSDFADWHAIRSSHVRYRSPFFSVDFIAAVERAVPGVEVALLRRGGKIVALLPFRRVGKNRARPVGAGINDAHGLLADESYLDGMEDFLKQAGLRDFLFHASPTDAPGVERFAVGTTRAFLADLTVDPKGYEHFLRGRNRTIDKQGQKSRKLGREIGALRFDFDCRDPAILRRLIELKRQQYQRTHTFDILGVDWIQRMLYSQFSERSEQVKGLLSVLYAGNTPVAMHYGMLDGDLLHYWFPVFDPEYSFGSPGTQLFLDVAREAAERGVTAIDMGYGEQAYKHKLTNVISEMSYGLVDENALRRWRYRCGLAMAAAVKEWRLRETLKPVARRLMPTFGVGQYRS